MGVRTKGKKPLFVGMPQRNGVNPPEDESGVILNDEDQPDDNDAEIRSSRQLQAIDSLALGTSISEVARQLGVNRSTVHRWLSDPTFQKALANNRDELLEKTFDLHIYASLQATRKLLELLDSGDERLAFWAARTLVPLKEAYVQLDHERRIRRMEDLDESLYTG